VWRQAHQGFLRISSHAFLRGGNVAVLSDCMRPQTAADQHALKAWKEVMNRNLDGTKERAAGQRSQIRNGRDKKPFPAKSEEKSKEESYNETLSLFDLGSVGGP
jgi:hypothetical protein